MPEPLLEPLLEGLASLRRYRSSPSLATLRRVLASSPAASWLAGLDAIKVTGSNGKGSVAVSIAAILSRAGVRTGLFVSPHLQQFSERIAVDGKPLSDAAIVEAAARLGRSRLAASSGGDDLIAFEAITALAVEAFAVAGVEAVVAEAGIGGRHDATRLLPGRLHGLVSVDLEHRALLGDSLEEIGRDKADIASSGGTLMLGDLPTSVVRELSIYGPRQGVEVLPAVPGIDVERVALEGHLSVLDLRLDGRRFTALRTPLVGRHQAINCALAIRLARSWLRSHRPAMAEDEPFRRLVGEALPRLRLPGRSEWLLEDPPVLIDTAHTAAALVSLRRILPEMLAGRPWILVCAISSDKTPSALLPSLLLPGPSAPLLSPPEEVIVSQTEQRGGDPKRILDWLTMAFQTERCEILQPLETALERALDRARRLGGVVVVAGGLFLAAEARRLLVADTDEDFSYY